MWGLGRGGWEVSRRFRVQEACVDETCPRVVDKEASRADASV